MFTDPHFCHKNLVLWGDRPEGFEALISANWQRRVGADDVVYCLGDVCFKTQAEAHEQYIKPMPGRKILILGNHDKQKPVWYLNHGWDEVHTELMVTGTVNGRHTRILLSHEPRPYDYTWDLNVHGHFHANLHRIDDEVRKILTKRHILLSMEFVNYDFVTLLDLVEGRVEQPNLIVLNE